MALANQSHNRYLPTISDQARIHPDADDVQLQACPPAHAKGMPTCEAA